MRSLLIILCLQIRKKNDVFLRKRNSPRYCYILLQLTFQSSTSPNFIRKSLKKWTVENGLESESIKTKNESECSLLIRPEITCLIQKT